MSLKIWGYLPFRSLLSLNSFIWLLGHFEAGFLVCQTGFLTFYLHFVCVY